MNFLPDQLVQSLAAHWTANRPEGLDAAWPIYDFTRTEERDMPCVVIGHEGYEREKAKGMDGTGKVKIRVVAMTDKDLTPDPDHRAAVAACDKALLAMKLALPDEQPLELVYLHDLLQEQPASSLQDHRQLTVLSWTAVATLMQEV